MNKKHQKRYTGKDGKLLLKVPEEVLLKQVDKLIASLREEKGKDTSYIQELEDKIQVLERKVLSLQHGNTEWSKEIMKEELYSNLRRQIKLHQDSEKKYRDLYKDAISRMVGV